jgi:hypothetical protein
MEHSSQKKLPFAKTVMVVALGLVASTAGNAFLMMMATTEPAYAAPSKQTEMQSEDRFGASASWDRDENVLEIPGLGRLLDASIFVDEENLLESDIIEAEIRVQLTLVDGNVVICAQGSTPIDPDAFDMDKQLRSATLSPVTVEVVIFDDLSCSNATGTAEITIQATWEGIGDITKFTSHQKAKNTEPSGGVSIPKVTSTTEVRQAIAQGSINNVDLGTGTDDSAEMFHDETVQKVVTESTSP